MTISGEKGGEWGGVVVESDNERPWRVPVAKIAWPNLSENDKLLAQTSQGQNENDGQLVKKSKGKRSQSQSEIAELPAQISQGPREFQNTGDILCGLRKK